jgi:ATP-dependent helicase HrpA
MSWQREGILWLMSERFKSTQKSLYRYYDTKILLRFSAFGSSEDLRALFYRGVLVQVLDQHVDLGQMPVSRIDYEQLVQKLEPQLVPAASKFAPFLVEVLTEYQRCRSLCLSLDHVRYVPIIDDVLSQLDSFEISRFTFKMRWQQMEQFTRYLNGTRERLERLPASTMQDLERTEQINRHEAKLKRLKAALDSDQWPVDPPEVVELDSMLQELRISLFAQPMKTLFSVSDKRVERLWEQLKQKLGLT